MYKKGWYGLKNVSLLVWVSQLGLSVAVAPALFILLAVYLRNTFAWGSWVIWVGIGLGLYCAITGFVSSLRMMERLSADRKKEAPPVAFNQHD